MAKNLNTVFPFYDALTEQYRYREDVTRQPFIISAADHLPPFIIRRLHNTGTTANLVFDIVPLNSAVISVTPTILNITAGTSYDYIWYDSTPLASPIPPDELGYYLHIHDEGATPHKDWYSEVFLTRSSIADLLKLSFTNAEELANIGGGFIQSLYINSILKVPEYPREDTGDKRDGLLVKEKQSLMKADIIRMISVPEYLVDGLMLLPLMDDVSLYLQDGSCIQPLEVRVGDPEWSDERKGAFAKLKITLIESIVIKKLNFKEMGCNCNNGVTGTQYTQGKRVYLTAGVTSDITWDVPFANNTYTFLFTGYDANWNQELINYAAQTATYLRVQSLVDCEVHVIATGSI